MSAGAAGAFTVAAVALTLLAVSSHPGWAADRQLQWNAEDCDFAIVLVPASRDTIQPHVPEGFTPTVPEEAAQLLPPDPRMEAVFGYEVLRCVTQTVGEHLAEDVAYASLWTFVEPPARLADPDFPLAFIKWTTMTPDPDQRRTLDDLDVPVVDGSADLTDLVVTPVGAGYDVTFHLGAEQVSYRTTGTSNNPTTFEGRFIEYSPLAHRNDGFARWRTHFTADLAFGGSAIARWDQDAFATQVLGKTEAQAWVLAGSGLTFADGTITVPLPGAAAPDSDHPPPSKGQPASGPQRTGALPATGAAMAWPGMLVLASALLADRALRRPSRTGSPH